MQGCCVRAVKGVWAESHAVIGASGRDSGNEQMGIGVTRFSQNALNPQVQLQPLRLEAVVGEDSRQRKTSNSRFTGKRMVGFGANPGEWVKPWGVGVRHFHVVDGVRRCVHKNIVSLFRQPPVRTVMRSTAR